MNGSYALIGTSAIIRHVQHLIIKVAATHSTVLITGEAGTGKEVVAKMIHDRSERAANPFIPIKCNSVNEELFEMEVFGVEDPNRPSRVGSFVQAQNGTLYIDEINKLSPRLQLLFLRALQDMVVKPVGSTKEIPIKARIIAASSVDLDNEVRKSFFREDLFFKLSSASIYLPPLRERREDIPVLASYFVQKFNQLKSKKITNISHDAMNALLQHMWIGNIQELENLIERIVVLKNSGNIEICDLPPRLRTLVTDNIDEYYDKQNDIKGNQSQNYNNHNHSQNHSNHMLNHNQMNLNSQQKHNNAHFNKNVNLHQNNIVNQKTNQFAQTHSMKPQQPQQNYPTNFANQISNHSINNNFNNTNQMQSGMTRQNAFDEMPSDIDQFIKKEIDLGNGIDFYRVVEEFENRLISEALRRTNHNKNRAAQLLSMNRTTLVEKLKKRVGNNNIKNDGGKIKRNSAFTIFDGLGDDGGEFDTLDYISISNEEI